MTTRQRTCGCDAGILRNRCTNEIERCDDCSLFATDDDAAAAVDELIRVLGNLYEAGDGTVADAFETLRARCRAFDRDALVEVSKKWRHVAQGDGIACYRIGPHKFVAAVGDGYTYDPERITRVRRSTYAAIGDAQAGQWKETVR